MKLWFRKWILVLMGAVMVVGAQAADRGTADEAVALVKKVIVGIKTNGPEKTFAEINDHAGAKYVSKDLYVFVGSINPGNPTPAHGANLKLVGKVMSELKDVDGVPFTRMFREVATSKAGKGWVDYKWPDPITKELVQKSTYVERFGDYYVAAGIYK